LQKGKENRTSPGKGRPKVEGREKKKTAAFRITRERRLGWVKRGQGGQPGGGGEAGERQLKQKQRSFPTMNALNKINAGQRAKLHAQWKFRN